MIKKLLYVIALLASFTACTGDYTDWAEPMSNAQGEVVSFGNGSIESVSTIDLKNYPAGSMVQVFNVTEAPTIAKDGYALSRYELFIEGQSFGDVPADGKISADELTTFVVSKFGKRPEARTLSAYVVAYFDHETTPLKITSAPFEIVAIPEAPVIYPHLYLIGAPSAWDPTCTTMPFTHSGNDVYDDPVFTVSFVPTEGENWFAFADDKTVDTNDWSNVFGCYEGNGKNPVGSEGKLGRRTELSDDGSFMVSVNGDAKFIKVTVNMLDGTYLIEKVNFVDYIYLPGNAQGWDPGTAAALKGDGNGLYTGYAVMDGDFKFTQERAWAAEYNNASFTTCSAEFSLGAQDGGNISFTGARGLYYFTVNVATGDLSAVRVEKMGLIGDFNGWGTDDEMTWNDADLCFEKTGATVTAAGWKFRMNGDWAVNLGGDLNDLQPDGSNIAVAGSTVKLYPCRTTSNNIYCTVE